MNMRIESSENFGLAFNCIVRLYKQNYNVKLLALMHRICDEYLMWFSFRIVFCAVRDLLHDRALPENKSLPEKQKISFERLLQRLVKQCITLEYKRCEPDYTKEEALRELGQQMGFIPGVYEEVRFQCFEMFLRWVKERHLDMPAEYRLNYSAKALPIKKRFIKDFGTVCLLMVRYSLESEAYMRYACYSLIYHNVRLLEGNVIFQIQKCIKNVKGDRDVNCWVNLKNVLDKEKERRKLLKFYEEIYDDEKALNPVLAGCISADGLVSYEKCREAWWRVSVFEEFLKEQEMSEWKLRYEKLVNHEKEIISRELNRYGNVSE